MQHSLCATVGPARSLFISTITVLLVFGSANTGSDILRSLATRRMNPSTRMEHVYGPVLRLRGAGEHDSHSDANAEKELGNAAYKEKKFAEALEHYEKVYSIRIHVSC